MMRTTDNLGGITAFVTTAQLGSFTAAAERLGLTKSAVGKSVGRLELRLGLTLFQRVDLPSAFGRQRVLPILLAIARQYPALLLTVTFSERFVDLIEEGIDLVVRIGELADSSGLVARRLTTQKLVICAAPGYLLEHGKPQKPEEILLHRCVVGFRRHQPLSWLFKAANGQALRLTPPATYEFADGDAMLAATLAGCGLSQLPRWLVGEYLQRGELEEVLCEYAGGEMPISAVWPKSRQPLPKVRYAVDELLRAAAKGRLD
jgi:DNA-binding transcriptional LysR family regulator